jgi:hypothetical protein
MGVTVSGADKIDDGVTSVLDKCLQVVIRNASPGALIAENPYTHVNW